MIFVRVVAAVLVLYAAWRLSERAREPFQERVRALEEWQQLLARLIPLIEWRRLPLPDALWQAASAQRLLRPAFKVFTEELRSPDYRFDDRWERLLIRLPGLWGDDRRVLSDLGRVLGTSDTSHQHRHIAAAQAELERLLVEARTRRSKDGRLFSVLVNALGLTVVILLL